MNRSPLVGGLLRRVEAAEKWIVSMVSVGTHVGPRTSLPPIHFTRIVVVPWRIVPERSASKGWSIVLFVLRVTSKPLMLAELLMLTATRSCKPGNTGLLEGPLKTCGVNGHTPVVGFPKPGSARQTFPVFVSAFAVGMLIE